MTWKDDYWGVKGHPFGYKPEERKAIEEWEKQEEKNFKKPNAKPKEIYNAVKNERPIDSEFTPLQQKSYTKGDWGYMVDENGNITATYLPSMTTELRIMYEWENGKWKLLTYREGNW